MRAESSTAFAAATSMTSRACCSRTGVRARPYHAGLERGQRKAAQEAFIGEEVDVIVATVAFGMGIDRSNVRFVLHAAMPKSVEHYQQESGRAGRDGLEAECVLLFGGGDFMTWKRIIERSAAEATEPVDPSFVPTAIASTSRTWSAIAERPAADTRTSSSISARVISRAQLQRLRPVPGWIRCGARFAGDRPENSVVRRAGAKRASASIT